MRHLTNFLPALAQHDANNEYDVLVREGIPDIALAGNVRLVRMGGRQDASSRRCLHRRGRPSACASTGRYGEGKPG
jgi:hypothetical protein